MEIPAREAVHAGIIREEWLDPQKPKFGKLFDKYYNCQWLNEVGQPIAEHRDQRLDKLTTVSYDLLDALRLALLSYEFLREVK